MKRFLKRLTNPQRFTPYAVILSLATLALIYIPALEPIQHPGITIIALTAAITIAYLEHRRQHNEKAARLVDTLNGNLLKMVEALELVREIMNETAIWDALPARIKKKLRLIEDRLGNLAAKVQGYRQFAELRDQVLGDRDD